MVTQMYNDVIMEATAYVHTIYTSPINLFTIESTDTPSLMENLTVLDLTKTYLDAMMLPSLPLCRILMTQLLKRVGAEQNIYLMVERWDRTRVQLSNFSNDFYFFYIRNILYMPVSMNWLSQVISVPFRFLYIEQYELFLSAVLFLISLFRLSIFWAQISAT